MTKKINKELSFEQQQAGAYAFLDAFYNRADFGYDVRHWQPDDVNQTIIDIVNQMGMDIVTNTRVTSISEVLFTICNSLTSYPNFVVALIAIAMESETMLDAYNVFAITQERLIQEKAKLRKNRLAWAIVTRVMAREKGNIELAFNGFI